VPGRSSPATCPAGTVVLGGGYTSETIDLVVPFTARTSGTTFDVIGINYDSSARSITAQAICATSPSIWSAGPEGRLPTAPAPSAPATRRPASAG